MSSEATVLVTGGSGLIGRAVQAVLAKSPRKDETWVFLSRKDADLTDLAQTRAVFEKHRPTHVLHLASAGGGLVTRMSFSVELWLTNVAINNNVMICAQEHKVVKMVSCINASCFPECKEGSLTESMLHSGPPHHVAEPYSYAQRMVDTMSRAYRSQYGCNFVCTIAADVYGPFDNFSLMDAHIIASVISKCHVASTQDSDVAIFGSPKALHQCIFSEDLAELLIWTMDNYNEGQPIILAADEEDAVSLEEVAQMVAEAYQLKGQIGFDQVRLDGQERVIMSNAKLKRYLPDVCFTPMKEGIAATVKWFQENHNTARM